ncbi:AAA family ATPase [Hymenobacter ruricola]|uniref:ATP-binding protein n=1 Tax=Hymenobacter ruricola TaxID=2791023 RepID=A0ABS0HZK5_9BACT|nr:AAA family ATPase [Hymenobacter ruricola]MBF9220137.1 ATP-binding protein [Hymenobacter ruricola]
MEMNLVAEGFRKFATLYKLLANRTLTPETTLFWDEPEANLNPALLKDMAAVLTELAKAGFQIILATHSLFLLKELHILAQRERQPVKYFALYAGENGATQVETKDDFIQLEHVAGLDAELTQTYDFEDALDQADADDNGTR